MNWREKKKNWVCTELGANKTSGIISNSKAAIFLNLVQIWNAIYRTDAFYQLREHKRIVFLVITMGGGGARLGF